MAEINSSSNAAPSVPSGSEAPVTTAPTDQPAPGSQPAAGTDGTQAPGSTETKPEFSFDAVLTDEDKSYLKSQGVDKFDGEGIKKFVASHKSLRAEKKSDVNPNGASEALAAAMGQPVQQPAVTPQATQDTNASNTQQPVAQQPAAQENAMPSQVEIFNFTNSLAGMYPAIKDNINNGQLFKDMGDMGIAPASGGSFNVQSVLNFAKLQNEQATLRQQLEEATKPSAGVVPEARLDVDTTQPTVTQLDDNSASQIILWSNSQKKFGKPVHPQFEDAQRYFASKHSK